VAVRKPACTHARLQRIDATSIQFVKGIDETVVPEVSLTRSRDGSNGTGAHAVLRSCR